jgi:eukaryotic-like serine/threonine-protein kinase
LRCRLQEVQAGAPLAGALLPMGSIIKERYIVEDLLGQGGFGAVYLVKDARVRGNMFALKEVVDPDRKDRERFLFEAELLKRLEHRALPRVYRIFDDNEQRAYMLMDYIQGSNLEMLRQQQLGKRFPLSEVLALMAPIVDAIAYLHNQNPPVIHRDIKPSNIIAPISGDDAVLVDFGIAKEHSPDTTTTAIRRCSPGYAAPEQYGIGTSTLTDIYGLGATFYTLLTGTVPTDALHRITELNSTGNDPLIPIRKLAPDVPPHIASIIHRALSLNGGDRFSTVDRFWQAMNGSSASQKLAARKLVPFTPAPLTPANPTDARVGEDLAPTLLPDISSQSTLETPTISLASLPGTGTRHRMRDKSASYMSRRSLKSGLLLLALLALLVAIGIGPSLWFLAGRHPSAHSSNTSISSPHPAATSNPSPTTRPARSGPVQDKGHNPGPLPYTATPTKSIVPTIPIQHNQPVAMPTRPPVIQSSPAPTPFPTATPAPNPTALPTGHPTPFPTATPAPNPTALPTGHPTPQPTPRPTPTPTATPTPVVYPNVSGNYNGIIRDTTEHIVTSMALSISQRPGQGAITGYFSVGVALVGSNNFAGTINTQKYIQFVVQSYKGNAPLYFWGWVQANGSMRGSYCSINSHNQCDHKAGDAGTWNVSLVQSGSSYMLSISKDNVVDVINSSLMPLLAWITGMILMCILLLLIIVRYDGSRRG